MDLIKVGVVGIGNMGSSHIQSLDKGKIKGATLAAVYSRNQNRIEWVRNNTKGNVQIFQDEAAFFNESGIDAVLIATPHYSHPELAKKAFAKGMHVLIEKPAGVFTKNVLEMNQAAKDSGAVFAIMYNQRANPLYRKLRELIHSGELGELKRTNWIVTDTYRSQSYYDSSSWRATWSGEGGGVILNQALHHLDIWQWATGLLPKRLQAKASIGKYHVIEVEDDVTAYVEYENGATGVFIASTGEAPGTNRLEIIGDLGKIVIEHEELTFYQLSQTEREFNKTYTGGFGKPEWKKVDIAVKSENANHANLIQNWIDSIRNGTPLLAPGEEGINALEIANAMYLSSWLNKMVDLPVNPDEYYAKLQEKINSSTFKKKNVTNTTLDVKGTH